MKRVVVLQDAYNQKRDEFTHHRTVAEQEEDMKALDQLRLQKQKVNSGYQRHQKHINEKYHK